MAAPGLYGCYGGLHLSIFDTWKPEFDGIIDQVKALGMERWAAITAPAGCGRRRRRRHGVPIIKGTDAYLSYPKRSRAAQRQPCLSGQRR